MVLSWLVRSRRSESVDDLVARRQYAKAVEAFYQELEGRQPTAAERLRLADLLILAGRGEEAVPILLGVADEQNRFGFDEKAVEALRRAREVQPGNPEVEGRLARLQEALPSATSAVPGGADPEARPSDRKGEGPEPTPEERLREAESLVAAGRDEDAVLSLLLASDELARRGSTDEALKALKRAKKIEPGRPDVGRRIQKLREAGARVRKATAAAARAASGPGPRTAEAASSPGGAAGASAGKARGVDPSQLPELSLEEPVSDEPELELVEDNPGHELPELHALEPEPADDEPRPLLTEAELDDDEPVLRRPSPSRRRRSTATRDPGELHELLLSLGRLSGDRRLALGATLFADFPKEELQHVAHGLQPRLFSPGEVLVTEGDPGNTLFLIASGSVRIIIMGGHGRPFDIRRLEAGDFVGEVAVLKNRPRTATVVAATPCQVLEIERRALETLLKMRPGARELLEEVCSSRTLSQEEEAVRSLPPEAADPDHAAAALQAHFGSSDWSPRVRTYLARLMLDAGRQDDALAILASVAQDLARRGRAQKAITLLKTVETIRKRGVHAVELSPPRPGRRRSARHAGPSGSSASASRAAKEAAFREWVGLLIRATDELAARSAPPPSAEERDPTDPDLTQISAHPTIQRTRKELQQNVQVPEHVR